MNVLVTGAKGFIGKNLCESLKAIRDGKDQRERYEHLQPLAVLEYDRDSSEDELRHWCDKADFVFHLAGVNRPDKEQEFTEGNLNFTKLLVNMLETCKNDCPIMMSSSAQASLQGRFANSPYGQSKRAAEQALLEHARKTAAEIYIYRFPNVYGKWGKPHYNSAIATFCHSIARDFPITINDPSVELELLYIDDLVANLLEALIGNTRHEKGGFCYAEPVDHATLGEIATLLQDFKKAEATGNIPDYSDNGFSKKLHATYISYADPSRIVHQPIVHADDRGSFFEFIRTPNCGQISVNVTKPGYVKGQHWHHTKWEKFLVVSGEGVICLRKVGLDENGKTYPVIEIAVTSRNPQIVDIPPGYTHSLTNTSKTDDLVTIMWCNEIFDAKRPDTYFLEV